MNAAATYRVAAAAVLTALAVPLSAACGSSSGGSSDAAARSPAATGTAAGAGTGTGTAQAPSRETAGPGTPSASASASVPASVPADGSRTRACDEGTCEISVAGPTTIAVDGRRFGFTSFKVTRISPDDVTVEARTPDGTYLRSGVSPGGTAALNGLAIRVESVSGDTAVLALSPAK